MEVPSGRKFGTLDFILLPVMVKYGFVRYSDTPFRLRSGIESNVYVFGREDLTDNPVLEWHAGQRIADEVWEFTQRTGERRRPCLIGVPTAGTALAQAAAMAMHPPGPPEAEERHWQICHRIMREVRKEGHGAAGHQGYWVNGRPDFGRHCYMTLDNTATDGQSKIDAAAKLIEDGYPAKEMPCIIFVDRQQGGVERLRQEGFKTILVVYQLLDITFAFGELGLWSKSAAKAVEEEIRAHQFLSESKT